MGWNQAQTEVLIRLCAWSLREATREVDENYPMLRMVCNGAVGKSIGYLESLGKMDQHELLSARVKFIFSGIGVSQTGREAAASARYVDRVLRTRDAFERVVPPGQRHSAEEKREFRAESARAVGLILGVKLRHGEFTKQIGSWTYRVQFDFGKRFEPGLECVQYISRTDGHGFDAQGHPIGMFPIGLVDGMGIGHTHWGYAYYTHLNPIVEALAVHVNYMFAALPDLLDGLNE